MSNPMTSAGDMIYGIAGGTPSRLASTAYTGQTLQCSSGVPTWAYLQGAYIKSGTSGSYATSGKVLTADGNGNASWQTAGGGGGSGDVTASGTLSVGSVIVGLGSKTITASNGTNYKFLGWSNGAAWKGLYQHTIHFYNADSIDYGPVNIYFSFISTSATAITLAGDAPVGIFPATGVYDNSGTYCPTVYVDTDNAEVGYINPTNGYIDTMLPLDFVDTAVTDTVIQIQ
jgi:hypothetical protein